MSKSTRLLLWISALGLVLLVLSTVAVALVLSGKEIRPSEPRTAVIRLGGDIPDAPMEGAFILDAQDFPPLLTAVTRALRAAGTDDEVSALVLDIRPLGIGWAATSELADAIAAYKESGKPCTAVGESFGNREYLLAATCGDIHIAPAGLFLVNGLSVTQTYFAGTLEKVGVKANLEHVGEYKSAVEPYERTEPSEESREATDSLLDGLYGEFISALAAARGMDEEAMRALVDASHLTPDQALAAGLVDAIEHRQVVLEEAGDEDAIHLDDLLDDVRSADRGHPYVTVLHAEGTIVSGPSGGDLFGDANVSDRRMVGWLEDAMEDDDAVAVVLRVNSPGGDGLASDNIWKAVERLKEKKPVVVSMSDYAASGGYYISMGADAIVAEPTTLTGSIGVFGGKLNTRGLFEKVGVTFYDFKRGENADLLSGTHDFSEAGRERFREFLGAFYELFLTRAGEGRGKSRDEMDALARGRVWTGRQALERGLVDELGGLDVAIARARELAEVTEETGIRRWPQERTVFQEIMEDLEDPGASDDEAAALARLLEAFTGEEEAIRTLLRVRAALAGNGVAALLPYGIEVR